MHFCYIDESGNTGNKLDDPNQPYLLLATLILPPEAIKVVEDDVRALGYKHFGAESRNTDFEFHGDAIYNGRDKYFKKLSLDKRFQILSELLDIVIKHTPIMLGYICVDKAKYYGRLHIQQTAFQLLVEKIEEQMNNRLNSHALLIADEQDELEQMLIDDLELFKQSGTTFGYKSIPINKVIDSVHFVQSHNNYLMQLTDVVCYLLRKGKESNKSLRKGWLEADSIAKGVTFEDWLIQNGTKGQKYFADTYQKLQSEKSWVFSKDFP